MNLDSLDYTIFGLAMCCLVGIFRLGHHIDSGKKEIKMSAALATSVFGTLAQFLLPVAEQELPVLIGALENGLNNLLAQHGHQVKITPMTPPDSVLPTHP